MTARQFLAIVEIRTKVISASTYLLATLYAMWAGYAIRPVVAVLLAIAVLCVDMGTTGFNSFFDYYRGVDSRKHNRERDKVLVHEQVAPGIALIVSAVLFVIAGLTGLAVALLSTGWIVVVGGACLIVALMYNAGSRPISATPLGELFAGGALGTALFAIVVAAHSGVFLAAAVVASIPGALIIASVLTVNNTCDIDGDRDAGRRTLSAVIGRTAGELLVYLQGTAAFVHLTVMSLRGRVGQTGGSGLQRAALPAAGVIVAPLGFAAACLVYVAMHRRGFSHATKAAQMAATVRVVVVFTITYALILVAGMLTG